MKTTILIIAAIAALLVIEGCGTKPDPNSESAIRDEIAQIDRAIDSITTSETSLCPEHDPFYPRARPHFTKDEERRLALGDTVNGMYRYDIDPVCSECGKRYYTFVFLHAQETHSTAQLMYADSLLRRSIALRNRLGIHIPERHSKLLRTVSIYSYLHGATDTLSPYVDSVLTHTGSH